MVLLKRLDYGFNGYQEPPIPRAPRSIRRRGSAIGNKTEDNKMCAFDLLATVAGNLLLEKVPTSSNNENSENKELKVEPSDRDLYVPRQAYDSSPISEKESSLREEDPSGTSSVTTGFVAKTSDDGEIKNEVVGRLCSKVEETTNPPPAVYRESGGCKLDDNGDILVKEDEPGAGAKAPFCGVHSPQRDGVKIVSRDDDENSSGCTHPSPSWTRRKHFRQAPRIGDRRIRKILASKYWRATAPRFKDDSLSSHDRILKPYRSRKDYQKKQRSQMAIPYKKRKIFDHTSAWSTDGGINNSQDYFNSLEKGNIGEASDSCSKLQGGKGTPRSVAGQHTSFQRRDSHVKLRIKSFRVPELFIEIPETATVGSLKRTVMEAVTAIFGGELRIGVLLQGQKVRDDNVTLLQSGISHDDQLDSLGFTLEPNPSDSPKPCAGESHFLTDDEPLPLVRYPSPARIDRCESDLSPEPDVPNLENSVESDHDSAPSPIDMSIEKKMGNSKALVTVPEVSVKALAVVPAIRKSKRPEMSQRRIRRPFSVTEVEALVHAVEKLGTGRWRDVKLRAFDDAKHRTYVDLKDKWKTLVHTARIAPQQRRGEPVPQELLDRVLKAHSYWSQQAAKQQLKLQSETCLLI